MQLWNYNPRETCPDMYEPGESPNCVPPIQANASWCMLPVIISDESVGNGCFSLQVLHLWDWNGHCWNYTTQTHPDVPQRTWVVSSLHPAFLDPFSLRQCLHISNLNLHFLVHNCKQNLCATCRMWINFPLILAVLELWLWMLHFKVLPMRYKEDPNCIALLQNHT